MSDRRKNTALPTVVAMLLASGAIHIMLWPLSDQIIDWTWQDRALNFGGGVMDVALLPSDGGADPDQDEEDKPKPEEDADQQDPRKVEGKLVKLDWLEHERAPKDAEFVSEFDSSVDRQTRAPIGRPGAAAAAGNEPGDRPDATDSPVMSAAPPSTATSRALSLSPQRAMSDEGQGPGAEDPLAELAPDGTMPGDPGGGASGGIPGLRGTPDTMRKTFGNPGTYDDLRELEEGEDTLLNSRRWKYASFFNRVRDGVAQHWHPEVVHAARDPEGRIFGTQTRVTRLRIDLNGDGSLHRIRIETPSGVDYLDEEAIRAVRGAQPFNNPPPQLLGANGRIEFDFGFIFELKGQSRVFRYRR